MRGGKDRKTLPPKKGRTAPMYFEGLKLRGNICLTPVEPVELRGEGNSRQRQIKIEYALQRSYEGKAKASQIFVTL